MPSEPNPQERPGPGSDSRAHQLCERAREHLHQGHYEEALTAATRAVEADRNCVAAYHLRKTIYLTQHEWNAVVPDLTDIIRLCPSDVTAYTQRALAYNNLGQFERAIIDCNKAIELHSTCAEAYHYRSHAFLKLGQHTESDADFRRMFLLSAAPDEVEGQDRQELIVKLLNRGDNSIEAGHPDDAVQAYSAVLLEAPNHIEARILRGQAYHAMGRFEAASADLIEACRLKKEHDKTARGFLVSVVGTSHEQFWAIFPNTDAGRCDATALAEGLVDDPSPIYDLRPRLGNFVQTKIYRFQGGNIELLDWVWSEEAKARQNQIIEIDCSNPDAPQHGCDL